MNVNNLLIPINKTAALVVNQSGCEKETEYIKVSAEIENVKAALKANQDLINNSQCKKEKRVHGIKRQKLQSLLPSLKEKLKLLNIQRRETMNSLIIRECMELFTENEWKEIVAIANSKFRAIEL